MGRTFEAFARLAGTSNIPEYNFQTQAQIFKDFEVGSITPEVFVTEMVTLLGGRVTGQEIIDAWNAMLLDIPQQRLDLLLSLKKQYRTFLFSNTNQIHYDAFNKILLDAHGRATLDEFFNRAYYSHTMGMRKPDAAAFQRILDENGLVASETLFLDDTPGHLEGAKLLGIQIQLVTAENGIMEILSE